MVSSVLQGLASLAETFAGVSPDPLVQSLPAAVISTNLLDGKRLCAVRQENGLLSLAFGDAAKFVSVPGKFVADIWSGMPRDNSNLTLRDAVVALAFYEKDGMSDPDIKVGEDLPDGEMHYSEAATYLPRLTFAFPRYM